MSVTGPSNRGVILVIEDGEDTAAVLIALLGEEAYEPVRCRTAAEGLAAMELKPVAVLLDWGLGDRPGIEVCRDIRAVNHRVPILFVSGRADEASVVRGLDAGANDFIIKPFRPVELIARIDAQVRSAAACTTPSVVAEPATKLTLTFGDVEVDVAARQVRKGGEKVAFGQHEFRLIEYLSQNPGVAISREQILDQVYGYGSGNSTGRIDMLVRRVRTKLGGGDRLVAVPGYGFRWQRAS